jgi:hypothetical protein
VLALLTMAGRRGLQCRHDQVQGAAILPACTVERERERERERVESDQPVYCDRGRAMGGRA